MKLIIALLFTTSAFACPNVQRIKNGTSSPCDGWLVQDSTMQTFAKTADELELTKKLVQAQEHLQKLSNAEIDFYKQRTKRTEKALSQSETQKFWVAAGAFALGVVLTGVAAKAAIESTR